MTDSADRLLGSHMTDIVHRLREDGSWLNMEAAEAIDLLRARVIKLEAQLGTTLGAMTFPDKDDRAMARFAIEYDIPTNTPR